MKGIENVTRVLSIQKDCMRQDFECTDFRI